MYIQIFGSRIMEKYLHTKGSKTMNLILDYYMIHREYGFIVIVKYYDIIEYFWTYH